MRSVACGPTMCTPSVSPVSAWAMTFAKPSYSPPMSALAIAWNGTLPDLDRQAALLALLLGQADRRDLGPAVGRPRLGVVVHGVDVGVADDRVDRGQALVGRRVGQPEPADDVADRPDVRLGGPHVAVDRDDPALHGDPRRLEAELLDVGGAPGRHQHAVGGDLLRLAAVGADHQADPVVGSLQRRRVEPGVRHDLDPAPLEALLELLRARRGPRAARSPGGTRAASPSRP